MARSVAFVGMLFVLGACDSQRDKDLELLWAQAVREDTIDGYIAFLAEQKHDEDAQVIGHFVVHVGERESSIETSTLRTTMASDRMDEIALATAEGACPFRTLYVDLRQEIQNVESDFVFSSSVPGKWLEEIGVSFTSDPIEADEILFLSLQGTGEKVRYYNPDSRFFPEHKEIFAGGIIEGAMRFSSLPQLEVSFTGQKIAPSAMSAIDAERDGTEGAFPRALSRILNDSAFTKRFPGLLYDVCGPLAGAAIYWGIADRESYSSGPAFADPELEDRMMIDIDLLRPLVVAAAFSERHHWRKEEARKFLLTAPGKNKDMFAAALRNVYPHGEIPNWLGADGQ